MSKDSLESKVVRCGCYQLRADHDYDSNVNAIEKGIIRASEVGVRIVVFPELATTSMGFSRPDDLNQAVIDRAMERFRDACRRGGLYAVIGTTWFEEDKEFNAGVVIDPQGKVVHVHKKVCAPGERAQSGTRFSLFEAEGVLCSVSVCWDMIASEMMRVPAIAGARILCHPHGHVAQAGGDAALFKIPEVRAYGTLSFLLFATFVGAYRDGAHWSWQDTRIIAPTGAVVVAARSTGDELIYADIKPHGWKSNHNPEDSILRDVICENAERLFGSCDLIRILK